MISASGGPPEPPEGRAMTVTTRRAAGLALAATRQDDSAPSITKPAKSSGKSTSDRPSPAFRSASPSMATSNIVVSTGRAATTASRPQLTSELRPSIASSLFVFALPLVRIVTLASGKVTHKEGG